MTTQTAALPLTLPPGSRQATLPLAGGKGSALAHLATAGLPVPNGFLITTAAYRRFTEANAIQPAIDAALAAADPDDQAALASAAAAIQARFDGGSLLDALSAAMLTAYASLGDMPAVAVRSSATAEDLPGRSFAGQQETLLNVRGADALLAAVRRCWASLWSARAIAYRERMGVGHADIAMAVVVQVMVAADVSCVLFTANPATGERSELLLNASYGLGEAIVSGAVTPDSFTIERQSRKVRNSEPGTKELMVTPAEGQGVVTRPVPTELRDRATLAEPELRELAALGLGVEQLFGGQPQDIEWALEGSAEGEAVLAGLAGYLAHYGHQIYTLDFAEPTQVDDPLPVLVGLRGLVQRPGQDVRQRQAALAAERAELEARTAAALGLLRRCLFRRLVAMAQHFGPYREEALFYLGAGWPALRRLACELGRRLVAGGTIGAADDVFYLSAAELEVALATRAAGEQRDLAALVGGRRALREQQRRLRPPAAVPPSFRMALGPIDLSSRETQRRNSTTSNTLAGFAVSPGRVTAPASVIRSPAEFGAMEPGTILVCPTTTPAWTPLFAQASGLVTDIGGVLAHGSIVAREYGIPAVMGTGSATERIVSGQVVTVDGDAGTVTLAG